MLTQYLPHTHHHPTRMHVRTNAHTHSSVLPTSKSAIQDTTAKRYLSMRRGQLNTLVTMKLPWLVSSVFLSPSPSPCPLHPLCASSLIDEYGRSLEGPTVRYNAETCVLEMEMVSLKQYVAPIDKRISKTLTPSSLWRGTHTGIRCSEVCLCSTACSSLGS